MSRAERIAAVGFDPAERDREAVTACNLCGATRLVEAARRDRYGYGQPTLVCACCGLGMLSPRLTAAEYARFYEDTYRPLVSAYHGRRIDAETVQVDQRDYADQLAAFLGARLPNPVESLLDVGGSTGVVAGAVAERLGCSAAVLDPAPDELEVAAAAGMETFAGFAEDFDPGDRRWQLVLLCQTIDHLLDVRTTLESLRRLTSEGGHLFVDVLDVEYAIRAKGGLDGAAKVDHPFYLTRTTGEAFLAAAGFEVVSERLSDDGHWGFLARAAEPVAHDAGALRRHADGLLDLVWTSRARPA
ncbi:class I SAM-dependent methyltransferase [Solirubrobacter ginsenosidimutans]|uniref:Class I SAM-dependent methyltransferase n=1 Tax=Solirubrobacter ginsenosidimutans TaxID=490573 RepID=A0A9X3S619_9ACTN|nr:class I SAM-dependent methyltransferase [Solirubrobacter ginsenosidimutans]MDA0164746.1 class I SAM-dependent methyltransferase [Solirubrobacter ginsenosidimutans]